MSESDDMLSSVDSTESVSSREESQDETSDEMEVVGQVQPYVDEPLAHTSDEDNDTREDEHGLLPAVLQSRFEGDVPINEWLVLFIFLEPRKITDFRMFVDTCWSMLRPSSIFVSFGKPFPWETWKQKIKLSNNNVRVMPACRLGQDFCTAPSISYVSNFWLKLLSCSFFICE